ncbi:MAG TPA: DNA alkylation repair protein [Candidatus Limnocylindrales bacterium]|nr:DNA alkylation repair protein [Candidatus Limnocylindrales bacterium]
MNAKQILEELKPLGKESYKRVLVTNHGVKEPCFGVSVAELKKIQKRTGTDYQLALDLYETGNYDAMYLAGLIADDARMTKKDLQGWAEKAYGGSLPGATVAWVAAEGSHGWEMALKWIESPKTPVASAGWATFSSLVSIKADDELDLAELKSLMQRVQKSIHQAPDAVRRHMNFFLISVGTYVKPLTRHAIELGEKIGPVEIDMGDNDCQVPYIPDHIRKAEKRGTIGKKRKSAKC